MKAEVSISRGSDNKVRIRFKDVASRYEFAEVALCMEDYAHLITGLSGVEGDLEVRGLDYVGKVRVRENRAIICPLTHCHREKLSKWLEENAQEDGWIIDTYLGSQGSVEHREGVSKLHYVVYKFVDPTTE